MLNLSSIMPSLINALSLFSILPSLINILSLASIMPSYKKIKKKLKKLDFSLYFLFF